jgi:hypothetical protein
MQSKDWITSKAEEKSPKLLKKSYKRGRLVERIKIKYRSSADSVSTAGYAKTVPAGKLAARFFSSLC